MSSSAKLFLLIPCVPHLPPPNPPPPPPPFPPNHPGKSTVSRQLFTPPLSFPLIDLDLLARDAVAPNSRALAQLHRHFGDDILTAAGELDRARLGEVVFHDEAQRKVLNSIVHPAVRRLLAWELVKCWVRGESVVVVDAPLLVEAGLWRFCGAVVVVYWSV